MENLGLPHIKACVSNDHIAPWSPKALLVYLLNAQVIQSSITYFSAFWAC